MHILFLQPELLGIKGAQHLWHLFFADGLYLLFLALLLLLPLQNINKCSVVWVASSIARIQGDKIHEMLLKEGMRAFQCGMHRDISLVVTKSDQMDLSEYKW